jgi:hypothetical protein
MADLCESPKNFSPSTWQMKMMMSSILRDIQVMTIQLGEGVASVAEIFKIVKVKRKGAITTIVRKGTLNADIDQHHLIEVVE